VTFGEISTLKKFTSSIPSIMRHARSAVLVVGDDGLDHRKLPRDERPRDREFP
jgi:hypothetical protein